MIFAHTLDKVIQEKKWQTRRLVKMNEIFDAEKQRIIKLNQRTMYQIGKTYAVQPNRGKKSVARILLTGLRKEPIQAITPADAIAEGFSSRDEFLVTWRKIHGKHSNINAEVWVFEFKLHVIVDEKLKALYERQNSKNPSFNYGENISLTLEGVSGIGLYGWSNPIGAMGAPLPY